MTIAKMLKEKTMEKKASFTFSSTDARQVTVAGDFNGWDGKATPLRKGKNDMWKRELSLKPGRYQYKFVVDGNWITDPNNNNRARNSYGTENSVIEII